MREKLRNEIDGLLIQRFRDHCTGNHDPELRDMLYRFEGVNADLVILKSLFNEFVDTLGYERFTEPIFVSGGAVGYRKKVAPKKGRK